ncbi:glycoside hydrolase family 3 N-terminal domain-containing protein [Palleronia caenipelagi]|uniref:beta-N-acetylhexosaminidase n=1 Tax=Palleronia caenipelagi TaxID=2489174 RepID=A0A547PXM6_9RHOB|nr:glycoside hydrolase family 3 N-terminal domain-containing protein [Palleronia caenipelagi]TRD18882.1 glycoside hydrolase family 3 protein [Palleronia caenipelagi]
MSPAAIIFGCAGPRLSADEAAFFANANPFGFIVFARNVETPDQLRALTSELRAAVGRNAPVLVDQEGGRVQRLTAPHWREWLPPLDHMRAAGADAERVMWLRARLQAEELRSVGIDVNCAPTADLARPETHPFLRNRCLGETVETVIMGARATADGLLAGGVLPVLKHIPGHGRARADSHKNLPHVAASRVELTDDFEPFRALADLPMAMTAHVAYHALSDAPATVDPTMIRLIREEIGFKGLLMTDDIFMEALGGTVPERSRVALSAGCDLVLHCHGDMREMEATMCEITPLPTEVVERAEAALALRDRVEPVEIGALEDELARYG